MKFLRIIPPLALLALLPGGVLSVVCPEPRRARDLIRGLPSVLSTALFGNAVHALAEDGQALMPTLKRTLTQAGIPPASIESVEPTAATTIVVTRKTAPHPTTSGLPARTKRPW